MLELKGIYKWYNTGNNRVFILKDVDLSVKAGEFISIIAGMTKPVNRYEQNK